MLLVRKVLRVPSVLKGHKEFRVCRDFRVPRGQPEPLAQRVQRELLAQRVLWVRQVPSARKAYLVFKAPPEQPVQRAQQARQELPVLKDQPARPDQRVIITRPLPVAVLLLPLACKP